MKELDKIFYSHITLGSYTFPIKIDLSLLTESNTEEFKYINIKYINNDIVIDDTHNYYEEEYKAVLNEIEAEFYFDFVDTDNKLFEGKNLKEFLNTNNLFLFLKSKGLDMMALNTFKKTLIFNIENCLSIYKKNIESLLELKNDKQMHYNDSMTVLQIPYEKLHIPYFKENMGKSYNEYSIREKILTLCYFSKVNMISNAIEREKSKILNSGKSSERKPSMRR